MNDKKKISNKHYREFLDNGIIQTINVEHLDKAMLNIKGVRGYYIEEGKALLSLLYYTGARPNELLRMVVPCIEHSHRRVIIRVPQSKGGLARKIYLDDKKKYVNTILKYHDSLPDGMHMFYHYANCYKRKIITKKGISKERKEISNKLRYYIKKWFDDVFEESITTYYLRHNRFSKMAESGADLSDIRLVKGSKTENSIFPYLHMSAKKANQIAKIID